jgi:hypothetical protein
MNDNRLMYDNNSYIEQLQRSIGPGKYLLNTPYDDCKTNDKFMPDDPYIRYQNYGPNTCTMKKAIDDSSELLGLNYKNSRCNNNAYLPGKYTATGCEIKASAATTKPYTRPTEDTRLSNPPCTLRSTGINRWQWLCADPQERAIEDFSHQVNSKLLFKDNHIPFIETTFDESSFQPNGKSVIKNDAMDVWQQNNKNNMHYSPGYPFGTDNNSQLLNCGANF